MNVELRGRIGCGWGDITYVRTRKGFLYTAFVTDVFSPDGLSGGRWSVQCGRKALPLQALNRAIVCAKKTTGLIHHCDHGSQYVSIVDNERLAEHGITCLDRDGWRFL
ncbi:DDE-type integrase/transposase/recombinase [Arcanobacterium phocae]|uniref:DDE-type integrase/transposase/recombinase n=1 Tax=Arcanobacterium phocae TaxID=131112 RepID=UPI001C0F24AC|nr:hypothetical protein [Arcanobacterium phocae]